MATTQNLTLTRGNTGKWDTTITDALGAVFNLTGCRVVFYIKTNAADLNAAAIFTKDNQALGGVTVLNAGTGSIRFTTNPADTASYPGAVTTLYYNIDVIESDNTVTTVLVGTLSVTANIPDPVSVPPTALNTTYVTLEDIRNEGLTDTSVYTDEAVQAALNLWAQYIERMTGQFFDVRALTLLCDGNDSDTLILPLPIITITALYMNGRFSDTPTDPSRYTVYNRYQPVDDRRNPKIKLVTANLDFYQMVAWGVNGRGFLRGQQNQKVVGTFGFVESDGSTPLLIKRALTKLIMRNIDSLATGGVPMPGGQKSVISSETTDGHSITYQLPTRPDPQMAITGDAEVDRILRMYRAPVKMAMTGTAYFAGQM